MHRISQVLFPTLVLLLLTAAVALAQGSNYSISRWTFGSGSSLQGGHYHLSGIAGQPDVGAPLSGGEFTLRGGLRPNRGSPPSPLKQEKLYLPIVVRSP